MAMINLKRFERKHELFMMVLLFLMILGLIGSIISLMFIVGTVENNDYEKTYDYCVDSDGGRSLTELCEYKEYNYEFAELMFMGSFGILFLVFVPLALIKYRFPKNKRGKNGKKYKNN